MASLPKLPDIALVRWRPLAAHDLPVVAALEARIHAAPWSERNFRDALAAGYSARVGVQGVEALSLVRGLGEGGGGNQQGRGGCGEEQAHQGLFFR